MDNNKINKNYQFDMKRSISFYKKGLYSFDSIVMLLFSEIKKYNYFKFDNKYKLNLLNKIRRLDKKERKIKEELVLKRLQNILKICIKLEKNNILEEVNELIKTTPYTILDIEKKEYSKEELLNVLSDRINFIKKSNLNKNIKNLTIERLLDAYNEINNIRVKKLK